MKKRILDRYAQIILIFCVSIGIGGMAIANKQDPETPIENLSFQAAEIRSVIRFLADYGQVNVVVAPDVKGTVTINLRDVKWDQAMEIIGQTYNLAVVFETDRGYIRVLPADQYRKERTEINTHSKKQQELAKLDIQIIRLANTAAVDIAGSVRSLLTERGKVEPDEHTNSLIIQEIPDNMERLKKFIKELDRPARQIRISTQLLEIYSTEASELGVSWTSSGIWTPNNDRSVTQTGRQTGDRVADPFISYELGAMMRGWDLNATISAIVSSGKGRIIAHPEITTIENKQARIQMGKRIPVKQFDESGNVVIKFEEVGTILIVTPHITADNQILMHLRPERSTLEPDPAGIIINTNNAETHVVVNNGQTAVIGGLTTQDEVESIVGIPILKDIPILGALFRYKITSTENRDLVIFVTPTIVGEGLADVNP